MIAVSVQGRMERTEPAFTPQVPILQLEERPGYSHLASTGRLEKTSVGLEAAGGEGGREEEQRTAVEETSTAKLFLGFVLDVKTPTLDCGMCASRGQQSTSCPVTP